MRKTNNSPLFGNLYSNPFVRNRFELMLKLLKNDLETNKTLTILDVGGYTADFYYYCLKPYAKKYNLKILYTVADYDPEALGIASKRGAITKKVNLNQELVDSVFKNRLFDVVISTEVLEHLLDPSIQLLSMIKLIKDNGVMLISLPNENTIFHRIKSMVGVGIDTLAFQSRKHVHLPTLLQSKSFLSKYLKIQKSEYYVDFYQPDGSGLKFLSTLFEVIPIKLLLLVTGWFPSLLARGAIYKCKKRQY